MSQRIEKGPKFTPAMGGAARRRPPAAPAAAAPPSTQHQQQHQQQHQHQHQHQHQQPSAPRPQPPHAAAPQSSAMSPPAPASAPTRSYAHTAPSATRILPSASSSSNAGAFKPPALVSVTQGAAAKRLAAAAIAPGAAGRPAAVGGIQSRNLVPPSSAIRNRAPSMVRPAAATSNALEPAPTTTTATPAPAPVTSVDEEPQAQAQPPPRRLAPPAFGGASSRSAFAPRPPAPPAPIQRVEPTASRITANEPTASTSRHHQQPPADRAIQFPNTSEQPHQQVTADTGPGDQLTPTTNKGKQREQPVALNGGTTRVSVAVAPPPPAPTRKRPRATPQRRPKGLPEGHPPKPLSAYFLFVQEKRAELRETQPDASAVQVTKLCAEAWRALTEEDRTQRERSAAAMRQQYDLDVAAWKERTPNWAALLAQAAQQRKRSSAAAAAAAAAAAVDGYPKRTPSAYLLYTQQTRKDEAAAAAASAGAPRPAKETFAEVNKRLGDTWRNLPLERKQPFLIQAEELKTAYQAEKQKWRDEHPDQDGGAGGGDTSAPSDGASAASDDESDYTDGGTRILITRSGKRRRSSSSSSSTRRRSRRAGSSRAQSEKHSISDDEREYAELVAAHGENLADLRFDPKTTNMADLAAAELKAGRVSKRTFELDRIRLKQLEDAAAARKSEKMKRIAQRREMKDKLRRKRRGEEVQLPRYDPRLDPANRWTGERNDADGEHDGSTEAAQLALMAEAAAAANAGPDQEEVGEDLYDDGDGDGDAADVEEALGGRPHDREKRADHLRVPALDSSDGEDDDDNGAGNARSASQRPSAGGNDDDDDDDEDDGAASDAGSTKTATSAGTYLSLRENAHAPQMRIVDGRIVIDESSLNIQRSTEQVFEEGDMIDEEAGHKFVNSSTGSKRQKSARWDARETEAFFRAVGMWGTDFEMIARMFPERTRKQIKTKWTREERQNPARLDAAFARRIPVDLGDYAIMANVDLSGPPPSVGVTVDADAGAGADGDGDGDAEEPPRSIKKAETEPPADGGSGGQDGAAGPALPPRKTSQTPDPSRHTSTSTHAGKPRSQVERERERSARGERERARRGAVSSAAGAGAGGPPFVAGLEDADEGEDGGEEEEEVLHLPVQPRAQAQALAGDW